MTPRHPELGAAIKQARLAKKLSQDELAERVGAKGGRFTVIRWEQGLHRPTEFADALVRELGIDPLLLSADADASLTRSDWEDAKQALSFLLAVGRAYAEVAGGTR